MSGGKIALTKEEQTAMTQVFKEAIFKKGDKQLHEIIKGEFEGKKLNMGINIAGKQKNLAGLSDKILSIFEFALSGRPVPPYMQKPFNDILEYGGLSPADFAAYQTEIQAQSANPANPVPSPVQSAPLSLAGNTNEQ